METPHGDQVAPQPLTTDTAQSSSRSGSFLTEQEALGVSAEHRGPPSSSGPNRSSRSRSMPFAPCPAGAAGSASFRMRRRCSTGRGGLTPCAHAREGRPSSPLLITALPPCRLLLAAVRAVCLTQHAQIILRSRNFPSILARGRCAVRYQPPDCCLSTLEMSTREP